MAADREEYYEIPLGPLDSTKGTDDFDASVRKSFEDLNSILLYINQRFKEIADRLTALE